MGTVEYPTDKQADADRRHQLRTNAERMTTAGLATLCLAVGLWDYRVGLAVAGLALTTIGLLGMRNHAGDDH